MQTQIIQIAFLVGRIIFGLYWLHAAYNHFKNSSGMAGYAVSKKVPAPKIAVIGSGILAFLGGLSILLGIWPTIGIILLIVFLLGVSLKMHDFWNEQDAGAKMSSVINFSKNMAIIGALLMALIIVQPWVFSL